MPGDEDAPGVAAEGGGVAVHPGQGGPALAHQLVHVDRGHEGVVHHHHRRPLGRQGARHEAEVVLVEGPPVAAVKEDLHRRRAAGDGAVGGKDVQGLVRRRTEGDVQAARQVLARPGAVAAPGLDAGEVVGHGGARVVLQVEGVLIVIAVDGPAAHGLAPVRGFGDFNAVRRAPSGAGRRWAPACPSPPCTRTASRCTPGPSERRRRPGVWSP